MPNKIKTHNKRYVFICESCSCETEDTYEITAKITDSKGIEHIQSIEVCHKCMLEILDPS